jgi:hypothetical protein
MTRGAREVVAHVIVHVQPTDMENDVHVLPVTDAIAGLARVLHTTKVRGIEVVAVPALDSVLAVGTVITSVVDHALHAAVVAVLCLTDADRRKYH